MSDEANEASGRVKSGFFVCANGAMLLDAEAAAVLLVACATAGVAAEDVATKDAATEEAATDVFSVASCADVVGVPPPVGSIDETNGAVLPGNL